tara:strand:+ start:200 stop:532 length:333 start_codon:yes stop_codon:yes gene_type:complete
MEQSKIFINLIISLFAILIVYNIFNSTIEEYSNCVFLSRVSNEPRETNSQFERRTINRLNELQERLDKAVFVYKFPLKNQEDLKKIGPMQQSISDSQSGDVTGDTKITGL